MVISELLIRLSQLTAEIELTLSSIIQFGNSYQFVSCRKVILFFYYFLGVGVWVGVRIIGVILI